MKAVVRRQIETFKLLYHECAVLGEKGLNNVLPPSFRVEVTMQYGIAIDLFPLKSDGLKSREGEGGG